MTTMIERAARSNGLDCCGTGAHAGPTPQEQGLVSESSKPDDASRQSAEAMSREICELAARISVATARLIFLIGTFDATGAWSGHGLKSCAHWLAWRCHLSPHTAREHVRVARQLRELPLLREKFERGGLSYAKVRALTRVADADSEADLVELAKAATAAQVEKTVTGWRRSEARPSSELAAASKISWNFDDDGMLIVQARLDNDDGPALIAAIQAAQARHQKARPSADSSASTADGPLTATPSAAEAFADIVTAYLTGDRQLRRRVQTELVVTVDADVLKQRAEAGIATYAVGGTLTPQQVREIACDTRLVTVLKEGRDLLAAGRGKRTVSPGLRRALTARDGGCAVPGCNEDRPFKLHAHHIVHWADGGPTDADNLVLLCKAHHFAVHNRLLDITAKAGLFTFSAPDGGIMDPAPELPAIKTGTADNILRIEPDHAAVAAQVSHGDQFDLHYIVGVLRGRQELRRRCRSAVPHLQAA